MSLRNWYQPQNPRRSLFGKVNFGPDIIIGALQPTERPGVERAVILSTSIGRKMSSAEQMWKISANG